MSNDKRKKAPIVKTIHRAVKIVLRSGNKSRILFTALWMFLGAVSSYTAVLNANFFNAAASVRTGKGNALSTALFWLGLWALIEIGISIGEMFQRKNAALMRNKISAFSEEEAMEKVSRIKLKYFDDREAQKKIRMCKAQLGSKISYVTDSALTIIRCVISIVSAIVILCRASWLITLIIIISIFPTLYILGLKNERYYELNQWQSFEGQMQRYLSLVISKRKYIKEMRFYRLYDYIEGKYEDSVRELNKQQMKLSRTFLVAQTLTNILLYGSLAAALAIISWKIFQGQAAIGSFVLVYTTVQNIQNNIISGFSCIDTITVEGRALEDYEEVLGFEEENAGVKEAVDVKEATSAKEVSGAKTFSSLKAVSGSKVAPSTGDIPCTEDTPYTDSLEIRFENVSFAYPGTDRDVLKDINLTIRQGEKIAIVGENGSGKSTFVSLLEGLYEPVKGKILVNGTDIRKNLGLLRKYLSCTSQEFLHFEGSIADNVAIGDTTKSYSEQEILDALRKIGMEEEILERTEGLNTILGNSLPGAVDLSGGQWQKVAIARNLIKDDALMMILDEPTAALDPLAESRLYERFQEMTKGKTAILISHRLGATRLADRILVFDNGQIKEDGTHEELLAAGKLYSEMYHAQSQWYV